MYVHLLETAVCSRSPTKADGTTAVPESTPNGHGAALLQITIRINCLVTAEDGNVRKLL